MTPVSLPPWWAGYVGRPYDRKTSNCYTLIRDIYRDYLGIDIGQFGDIDPENNLQVARAMNRESRFWRSVDVAEPFDVVLMRPRDHRVPTHVGIATGGRGMLHTTPSTGAVHVLVTDMLIRPRIVGFRRHPDVGSRALV